MAASLTSRINLQITAILQNVVGLANTQATVDKSLLTALASGVGATQADKVFSESAKSIAGNYDVDLSGVLLDVFGAAILFARIKAIAIFVDPTSVSNVVLGAGAANQFVGPFGAAAHTISTRPGGATVLFAPDATGWPVTAATADILRLAPSGASALFDWCVLGASA
jgi:hypothetical protein